MNFLFRSKKIAIPTSIYARKFPTSPTNATWLQNANAPSWLPCQFALSPSSWNDVSTSRYAITAWYDVACQYAPNEPAGK
jgi:hypothetical protein